MPRGLKQLGAVLNPRVFNLIEQIHKESAATSPTGKSHFSVNPHGTLQFLKHLYYLYMSMSSSGRYSFESIDDVRLRQCVKIVQDLEEQRAAIAAYYLGTGMEPEDVKRKHVALETWTSLKRCVYGMVLQLNQKSPGTKMRWPVSDKYVPQWLFKFFFLNVIFIAA